MSDKDGASDNAAASGDNDSSNTAGDGGDTVPDGYSPHKDFEELKVLEHQLALMKMMKDGKSASDIFARAKELKRIEADSPPDTATHEAAGSADDVSAESRTSQRSGTIAASLRTIRSKIAKVTARTKGGKGGRHSPPSTPPAGAVPGSAGAVPDSPSGAAKTDEWTRPAWATRDLPVQVAATRKAHHRAQLPSGSYCRGEGDKIFAETDTETINLVELFRRRGKPPPRKVRIDAGDEVQLVQSMTSSFAGMNPGEVGVAGLTTEVKTVKVKLSGGKESNYIHTEKLVHATRVVTGTDAVVGFPVWCYQDDTKVRLPASGALSLPKVVAVNVHEDHCATMDEWRACTGTIAGMGPGGTYRVCIDNAISSHKGRPARAILWDLKAECHASDMSGHQPGDRLYIADGRGGWADATVAANLGCSRYELKWAKSPPAWAKKLARGRHNGNNSNTIIDINDANHFAPQMTDVTFANGVKRYLVAAAKTCDEVQDGITQNTLRTRDQLIEIEMDTTRRAPKLRHGERVRLAPGVTEAGLEPGAQATVEMISFSGDQVTVLLPSGATSEFISVHQLYSIDNPPPFCAAATEATSLAHALSAPSEDEQGNMMIVHGRRSQSAAVLIKAAAGTGKTWLTMQLLHAIATTAGDASSRFVPVILRVQRLAFGIRHRRLRHDSEAHGDNSDLLTRCLGLDRPVDELEVLLEARRRGKLLVLLDGVDEAADLKGMVRKELLEPLLLSGARYVATSRPEGVVDRFYDHRFTVFDLKPLSDAQQRAVLEQQIRGDMREFVRNLLKYNEALRRMDELWHNVRGTDADSLTHVPALDRAYGPDGRFLADGRQLTVDWQPVESFEQLREAATATCAVYEAELLRICASVGLPVTRSKDELRASDRGCGLLLAKPKEKDRCEQKATTKYEPEVDDGIRPGPAMSWLIDVLRCSVVCHDAAQALCVLEELSRSDVFEVTRVKNYFSDLDPIHFRRLGVTVRVASSRGDGRPPHHAEVQIHLGSIFWFKADNKELMHRPYEFFRTLFGLDINRRLVGAAAASAANHGDGWMSFDARVRRWARFLTNPIMLSLFVVVMQDVSLSEMCDVSVLPSTTAGLYDRAIKLLVARKVSDEVERAEVLKAVEAVSLANHLAKRREFSLVDIDGEVPASAMAVLVRLLSHNTDDSLRVPTLKVLDVAADGQSEVVAATLQSAHLSLQEYMCAKGLSNGEGVNELSTAYWCHAELLGDPFNDNMLRFGWKDGGLDLARVLLSSGEAATGLAGGWNNLSQRGFVQVLGLASGIADDAERASTLKQCNPRSSLRVLKLKLPWLEALPGALGDLLDLEVLILMDCASLVALPESIGQLTALTKLDLVHCSSLVALPESIGQLRALMQLDIGYCSSLVALPESIGQLQALTKLTPRSCTSLVALPESIGQLKALTSLDLATCTSLATLPESIGHLEALTELKILRCTSLLSLPETIGHLRALTEFDMAHCTSLVALPESIGQLQVLKKLNLHGCTSLSALPESIGQLQALCKLDLGHCSSLVALPESLDLLRASIEIVKVGCMSLKTQ